MKKINAHRILFFSYIIVLCAVIFAQIYWVKISVRWTDIPYYLVTVYGLIIVSIALLFFLKRKWMSLAINVIIASPVALILGDYGRRLDFSVLNYATQRPVNFLINSYTGGIISGSIIVSVLILVIVIKMTSNMVTG
jgi:hypothetical protein